MKLIALLSLVCLNASWLYSDNKMQNMDQQFLQMMQKRAQEAEKEEKVCECLYHRCSTKATRYCLKCKTNFCVGCVNKPI